MSPWLNKAQSILDPELRPDDPATADLVAAFDAGFDGLGLRPAGTSLDQGRSGLLVPALATRQGMRRTVADTYLDLDDPNLVVMTGAAVASLIADDGRVTGVTLADGRPVEAPTVVLTAGHDRDGPSAEKDRSRTGRRTLDTKPHRSRTAVSVVRRQPGVRRAPGSPDRPLVSRRVGRRARVHGDAHGAVHRAIRPCWRAHRHVVPGPIVGPSRSRGRWTPNRPRTNPS